jgi:glycosyltransferase involved in cell wall biosynthesis
MTARSELGLANSDLVVAYIGRLSPEKQIPLLIEAFALIAQQRRDARLLIAGEGPELSTLQQQVDRLKLSNVHFLGTLTRERIRILLSSADVLALLSLFEGFSNAALEALACGLPLVTTNVGGMRELLGDRLGHLMVPSLDPSVVAAKIVEVANQRAALTGACMEQARRYDAKVIVPQLEELYRSFSTNVTEVLDA